MAFFLLLFSMPARVCVWLVMLCENWRGTAVILFTISASFYTASMIWRCCWCLGHVCCCCCWCLNFRERKKIAKHRNCDSQQEKIELMSGGVGFESSLFHVIFWQKQTQWQGIRCRMLSLFIIIFWFKFHAIGSHTMIDELIYCVKCRSQSPNTWMIKKKKSKTTNKSLKSLKMM